MQQHLASGILSDRWRTTTGDGAQPALHSNFLRHTIVGSTGPRASRPPTILTFGWKNNKQSAMAATTARAPVGAGSEQPHVRNLFPLESATLAQRLVWFKIPRELVQQPSNTANNNSEDFFWWPALFYASFSSARSRLETQMEDHSNRVRANLRHCLDTDTNNKPSATSNMNALLRFAEWEMSSDPRATSVPLVQLVGQPKIVGCQNTSDFIWMKVTDPVTEVKTEFCRHLLFQPLFSAYMQESHVLHQAWQASRPIVLQIIDEPDPDTTSTPSDPQAPTPFRPTKTPLEVEAAVEAQTPLVQEQSVVVSKPAAATTTNGPPDLAVQPHEDWETIIRRMESSGWNVFVNLQAEQVYQMPELHGERRELSLEAAQAYIRLQYGWKGEEIEDDDDEEMDNYAADEPTVVSAITANTEDMGNLHPSTPQAAPSPRQQLDSVASSVDTPASSVSSSVNSSKYEFGRLWDQLRLKGWRYVKGTGTIDWFYLKPGVCKRNMKLGVNAFPSRESVIAYQMTKDGYEPSSDSKWAEYYKEHVLEAQQEVPRSSRSRQSAVSSRKNISSSKSIPKRGKQTRTKATRAITVAPKVSPAGPRRVSNVGEKTARIKQHPKNVKTSDSVGWWRNEPVPTLKDVLPVIKKVGFFKEGKGYLLHLKELNDPITFENYLGVGCFLLRFGIPQSEVLSINEFRLLCRWASFVHVTKNVTPNTLRRYKEPSSGAILKMLRDFGFEVFDQHIYRPHCRRCDRKKGFDFFREQDLNTEFRSFLRWIPTLSVPHESETWIEEDQTSRTYSDIRLWAATGGTGLPAWNISNIQGRSNPRDLELVQLTGKHCAKQSTSGDDEIDWEYSDESTTCSSPAPLPIRKKTKGPWYLQRPTPISFQEMWPILQKMGFQTTGCGRYTHPNVKGRVFYSERDVQFFLSGQQEDLHRNSFELSKKECTKLHRWASFVLLEKYWHRLQDAKILKDNELIPLLSTLKFGMVDGRYYLPYADMNRRKRKALKLVEALAHVRSNECWNASLEGANVDTPVKKSLISIGPHSVGSGGATISESNMISLVLTAACCDHQIPVLATPPRSGRSSRTGRRGSLDEVVKHVAPKEPEPLAGAVMANASQACIAEDQICNDDNQESVSPHLTRAESTEDEEHEEVVDMEISEVEPASQDRAADESFVPPITQPDADPVETLHDICQNETAVESFVSNGKDSSFQQPFTQETPASPQEHPEEESNLDAIIRETSKGVSPGFDVLQSLGDVDQTDDNTGQKMEEDEELEDDENFC